MRKLLLIRSSRVWVLAIAIAATALVRCQKKESTAAGGNGTRALSGGASSLEELCGHLLSALTANDREAAEKLRVTKDEYVTVIMPGRVAPGAPPQTMPEPKALYFFGSSDTRSRYALTSLLHDAAGKQLRLKQVKPAKVEQFAWYTAYRNPRLVVENEEGRQVALQVGSIAELNGRYKFISFFWD